jgi:hypothetical protein
MRLQRRHFDGRLEALACLNGIGLRHLVFAHWLNDEGIVLDGFVFIVQEACVFRVEL